MGGLTGLFDLNNFTALVVAALGAGAVRELGFVTVGALADGGCGEVIVSATESRALLGMSPFRICHDRLPFNFRAATKKPRTQIRPKALLQFAFQVAKRGPAWIRLALVTTAKLFVAVGSTLGAQALAIVTAEGLDGHGEQNLLTSESSNSMPSPE